MGGYFFSFLVTHLVNFLLSLRLLLRLVERVLSFSTAVFTLLATGCAIFAAGHIYAPVLRGIGFTVILGCLLTLLGVISKEDLRWLRGLIKKGS